MNYERALATLNHARTGKRLERKKLENATWVQLVNGEPPCIDLTLFQKHILTWYPNGDIAIDNHTYWAYTTKDRLNKYMPSGFSVWQNKPYWYIRTPAAVLPYYNRMHLTSKGLDLAVPDQVHDVGVIDMKRRAHEYAKAYAARLVNGKIARAPDCLDCRLDDGSPLTMEDRLHALRHMNRSEFPSNIAIKAMMETTVGDRHHFHRGNAVSSSFLRDMLHKSWEEAQVFWRKPRTKKELIRQTEKKMTSDLDFSFPPNAPSEYRTNFRTMVEDYFLEYIIGFERMSD